MVVRGRVQECVCSRPDAAIHRQEDHVSLVDIVALVALAIIVVIVRR
jgi:hypothetical protein